MDHILQRMQILCIGKYNNIFGKFVLYILNTIPFICKTVRLIKKITIPRLDLTGLDILTGNY